MLPVLFFVLAAAEPPRLIPAPRSIAVAEGSVRLSPVRVRVRSGAAEDRFAAGLIGGVSEAGVGPGIVIGRAGDPEVEREIDRRGLDRRALEDPEGYVLGVDPGGALVAARTAAGIFYGVQTLRQLLRPDAGGARLPLVRIADWPALRHRGLMVDTSQGAALSPEMLRQIVATAAEYKLNLVCLYVEHRFPFAHSPLGEAGAQLGFEEMKRLAEYGRERHVEIVPQQQTFGHLHSLLKWQVYSDLGETPRGDVLAPGDPRVYEWIGAALKQLAAVFPGPFLHIGGDETFELGRGRSDAAVAREGLGRVYAGHVRRVAESARALGKRPVFWGDMALKNPAAIAELPKDLIAAAWDYEPRPDYTALIEPFRKAGLEVWVSPGVNNWRRIFPNLSAAAANIGGFARDGKRLGATGMLNTEWNDDGEEFFSLAWYGVVYGAAAAWQTGEVDRAAFDRAFDWAFYRASGDVFVKATAALEGVNGLLLAAGQGDAADELLWFDPFSHRGSLRVQALLPYAAEVRRRAEQALIELDTNAGRAREHGETLPFLRFAARRLDLAGLRLQAAKDIGDFYRDAQAHAPDAARVAYDFSQITERSGIGRIADVLDAVAGLKAELKRLWPLENRPYYLESLLVRYDAELLYWHYKRDLFRAVRNVYQPVTGLTAPEAVGLYLP